MISNIKKVTWTVLILFYSGTAVYGQLPPETAWDNPHFAHENYLSLPNPGYLSTVYDPNYNVNITRVSDENVAPFAGFSGAAIQHQYSEVQAWNADMSKYWLGFQFILNDSDNSVYKNLAISGGMHDGRWSVADPNIRYFTRGRSFKKINIATEQVTTLHTFNNSWISTINVGDYQGQISENELVVLTEEKDGAKAALYDIANNVVLHEFAIPGRDAQVSRSGKYIQVHNGDGNASYYDWATQLDNWVDGAPLTNPVSTFKVNHDNFAYNSNGDEVVINLSPLRMYRVSDGQQTDLLPATSETFDTCDHGTYNPYVGGHVSTPSDLPGWALVSAGIDDCNNSFDGFYHETEQFLVKLDGSGTIRPFGFSRSSYGGVPGYDSNERYFSEAKSAVRQDGKKITFTSDWYSADGVAGDIVQYVVEALTGIEDADFDSDSDVDGEDFLTWQRNLGLKGNATQSLGDANDDLRIDADDLSIWENQFASASLAPLSVPEPSSGVLTLAVLLAHLAMTRRIG